jgi:hypothetical protein
LEADLVGIDRLSTLGGSIPLIDSGTVVGQPRVPVAEQLQRPLDNFTGILVGAGPERLRNHPLVFWLQGDGHEHFSFCTIMKKSVL